MCISPCVIAMDVSCVAVADSSCVGGGEVWVPQQVADSPPKRGRLSVKGPAPSVFLLPPPPSFVYPCRNRNPSFMWDDVDEVIFEDACLPSAQVSFGIQ